MVKASNVNNQAIYDAIQIKKSRPWVNEEELRLAWVSALEHGLNIHFDAERGKKDGSYNNIIIEFKAPGLFNGSKQSPKFKEATEDRLKKYIKRAAKAQGMDEADYIGIAIDGEHICFAQLKDGEIKTEHLLPFTPQVVGIVIDAFQANLRRPVTADYLIEDFGNTSAVAINLMQVLADELVKHISSSKANKIKMLFEEWRTLYGQVADLSNDQASAINAALKFKWNGSADTKMSGRLFVIHTYNSLVIKLLAAEIVSAHGLTSKVSPAQEMAVLLDDDTLLARLATDVEKGQLFSEAGIIGFVEEAIFSWYLDACSDPVAKSNIVGALRDLLTKLSLYRTDRLSRTRDVLRDFYQDLVPETMRKSLGEFYTPDWLVDYTVSMADSGNLLNLRTLDPTCGSGAFLIEVIRRKRKEAETAKFTVSETINNISSSVWGFDLNPLAVQTARVSYLMEIADLLSQVPGHQVEIPVLLADAIYSPARNPTNDENIVTYKIGSQVARLDIKLPAELAFNRERLDGIFEIMGEMVEDDKEYSQVESSLTASNLLNSQEAAEWESPLKDTYEQVLSLHRKNWNGIWFRIVRNFFWSATAGRFDLVIGNPPWVRWSKLPVAYQERVSETCKQYAIFSDTPFHGGNELDISAMITYTTADKWLKTSGKLAFVITQTLFQGASSSGFRKFQIDNSTWISPIVVEDLKALKPFPDAANKTAIVLLEKGAKTPNYPVDYRVWGAGVGETRTIDPMLSLTSVLAKTSITKMEATPVNGTGSPWAILKPGRWKDLAILAGESIGIDGRKGITVDLNGLYFLEIVGDNKNPNEPLVQIRNRPEAGRTNIGASKQVWIEPEALYPLIKGASDFEACYLKPANELYALVPNAGITTKHYTAAETLINSLPKTRLYLKGYKDYLLKRSTYRTRMPNAPYYAVYNVGDFTFKPWKVIWAEMSGSFFAAVAGSSTVPHVGMRPFVPDHKVYFVAFDDKTAAHYLCGILNARIVKEYVDSHNISIQVGNIFKHLQLPVFNPSNKKHLELATLVEQAHAESDAAIRATIVAGVIKKSNSIINRWIKKEQSKINHH